MKNKKFLVIIGVCIVVTIFAWLFIFFYEPSVSNNCPGPDSPLLGVSSNMEKCDLTD